MKFNLINNSDDNNKYPFVYIKDDGSFRELTFDEKEYLQEKFHPNDGGRPYIKSSYNQLTPDKKINGFLLRKNLPKDIVE